MMREELELEMRQSVTTEVQTVDDNEKPLYSDKKKEKLVNLVKMVLTGVMAVSIHQLRNSKQLLSFILALERLCLNTKKLSMASMALLLLLVS